MITSRSSLEAMIMSLLFEYFSKNWWNQSTLFSSKVAVGSSNSNIEVSEQIARPSFSRCFIPEEKKRTQSLFYHAFNLRAFLRLAYYAEQLDVGFYDKAKKGAGSVQDSVDFVASYAGRVEDWPYKEINSNVEKSLWNMLVEAQSLDERQSIKDAIEVLEYASETDQKNLILGLSDP